ncbi:methyltransferase [bacterium]|nr:methyltransferase [bacterium]
MRQRQFECRVTDLATEDVGTGHQLVLAGVLLLKDLLSHLYVLVPVLDNEKHYWVGDDEVEKLLRRGAGWLAAHPQSEMITRRYLKHRRNLVDDALTRLIDESDPDPDSATEKRNAEEAALENRVGQASSLSLANSSEPSETVPESEGKIPRGSVDSADRVPTPVAPEDRQDACPTLNEQRLGAVLAVLKGSGAKRILDLGCGEGRLLQRLLKEKQFAEIVGMDVSHRALEISAERLHYDRLPPMQKARLKLLHGSLIYRDQRLSGFDAAAVVEVIEHLDQPRLSAFERVLFECARPGTVVITTPNREYNVKWETLPAGKFRHRDHRFEWTRAEFRMWANAVAERFGYKVRFLPVGPEDSAVGSPTQMGVFESQK